MVQLPLVAQMCFALAPHSAAGYAITSYLLQVKDRHNGNLMFDTDGESSSLYQ